MHRQVLIIFAVLGGWAANILAQDKPKSTNGPKVYLCTITGAPWEKQGLPPKGYLDERFRQTWIEIYFPMHKIAHKLGTKDFLITTLDRYQDGKPVVLAEKLRDPPLSKEIIENLWRTHQPTIALSLTELTLTEQSRLEIERKVANYLKKKSR